MITEKEILKYSTYKEIIKESITCIYKESKILPLKNLSSKKKGSKFEKITKEWLQSLGAIVEKSSCGTQSDYLVDGIRVEIKGSFLWGDGTHFRFQQIRTTQEYDVILFLCVFPTHVEFYVCSKKESKDNLEIQNKKGQWTHNQHGGKNKNSGTFFIDCFPSQINWMHKMTSMKDMIAVYKGTK